MPYRPVQKTCEWCKRTWTSSNPRARTCSPGCRARLRETEKPSRGKPQRDYPLEVIRQVQELYASGLTIREIGEVIGSGYKVQTLVERFIPERRPGGNRDQRGEKNHSWRGDGAGYSAMHFRVIRARGRPTRCACCDTTDPTIRYEWANLSGRYDDINDYARLCPRCHRRLDARRRAVLNGRTSPSRGGGQDA